MAYLGIEHSLNGRSWIGPAAQTDHLAAEIAKLCSLPDPVARTLARLGVQPDLVPSYLAPSLKELMPDPSHLRDMDKATARLCAAIDDRQRIAIFADYDVDGACSAALLADYLNNFGLQPTLYVPDRLKEGYGPNIPAMEKLAQDHDLIICVDCGTLSFDPIAAVKNTDVIVLDHHIGGESLPQALAIVNPNRQDEASEAGYLCAAGVVFLVLVNANRQRRQQGRSTPDLISLLDLVALATVADVAPLTDLNRAFVRQGLKVLASPSRPGLKALCQVAGLSAPPTSRDLGFLLGPRINAGGRIGVADLGVRLLTTKDPASAEALAERLDLLNKQRREIETNVQLQAMELAENRDLNGPLVWAAAESWHPGVVGIVAARLKEKTNRPAVVIGFDGDIGKGSGRSVSGIDLGSAIATCTRENLLLAGGGHKMAAGLTVSRENLEPAMARLSELLARQGAGQIGPKDLRLDGMIGPGAVNVPLVNQLETAGPFGPAAPAPRFVLADQKIAYCRKVGETHLQVTMSDASGARLDAICFGAFDNAIGPAISGHKGQSFHLAGRLEIDRWGGREKVKLRIEDAAVAI